MPPPQNSCLYLPSGPGFVGALLCTFFPPTLLILHSRSVYASLRTHFEFLEHTFSPLIPIMFIYTLSPQLTELHFGSWHCSELLQKHRLNFSSITHLIWPHQLFLVTSSDPSIFLSGIIPLLASLLFSLDFIADLQWS